MFLIEFGRFFVIDSGLFLVIPLERSSYKELVGVFKTSKGGRNQTPESGEDSPAARFLRDFPDKLRILC